MEKKKAYSNRMTLFLSGMYCNKIWTQAFGLKTRELNNYP